VFLGKKCKHKRAGPAGPWRGYGGPTARRWRGSRHRIPVRVHYEGQEETKTAPCTKKTPGEELIEEVDSTRAKNGIGKLKLKGGSS